MGDRGLVAISIFKFPGWLWCGLSLQQYLEPPAPYKTPHVLEFGTTASQFAEVYQYGVYEVQGLVLWQCVAFRILMHCSDYNGTVWRLQLLDYPLSLSLSRHTHTLWHAHIHLPSSKIPTFGETSAKSQSVCSSASNLGGKILCGESKVRSTESVLMNKISYVSHEETSLGCGTKVLSYQGVRRTQINMAMAPVSRKFPRMTSDRQLVFLPEQENCFNTMTHISPTLSKCLISSWNKPNTSS